uniref:Uncharacterized protein n=1 Tax=Siphoviridae sp. ctFPV4 TaxID=2827819 RepID=A0A8S5SJ39_9CAUD|nr:MAG TPA: hypothetical protein [Siphoviridae sp. ctFPV4]
MISKLINITFFTFIIYKEENTVKKKTSIN